MGAPTPDSGSSLGTMPGRWGTQTLSWGTVLGNSRSVHQGVGLHLSGSLRWQRRNSLGARSRSGALGISLSALVLEQSQLSELAAWLLCGLGQVA